MKTYQFEQIGNPDICISIKAEDIAKACEILVSIVIDSYKFEYKPEQPCFTINPVQ